MQIGTNNTIHDTAIIELGAVLGDNNYIGEHTIVRAGVIIGNNNYIGANCNIGDRAEKVGAKDLPTTKVRIGDNNTLYKSITIDSGTIHNTFIGDNCTLLKGAHLGHDAKVFKNVTLGCNVSIGGFTVVGEWSNFGLNSSTHPREMIPKGTMLGANSFFKAGFTEDDEELISSLEFNTWVGMPAKAIKVNEKGLEKYKKNKNYNNGKM